METFGVTAAADRAVMGRASGCTTCSKPAATAPRGTAAALFLPPATDPGPCRALMLQYRHLDTRENQYEIQADYF